METVRAMERKAERQRSLIQQYRFRLKLRDPGKKINEKRQQLADMQERMERIVEQRLKEARHRLALDSGRLHGLSPLERISNGFGFVTGPDGKRVDRVEQVNVGDLMTVRMADGRLTARVTERERIDEYGKID